MRNENRKTESFYTIARDETEYWDSDTLARYGIRAAFGLYLVRAGEGTHCCSLRPASWCEWVENAFIYDESATDEQRRAGDCMAYENGGESGMYLEPMVDLETHDSRFIAGPLEIDPADVNPVADYGETYDSALWGLAGEEWHRAPDQPAILDESTFDAWRIKERDRRRAENRPPCDFCRGDVLPLFGAAWLAAKETIGKAQGWGRDLDGNRRENTWLAARGWV